MRMNKVKTKLKEGEFVFGTMIKEEFTLPIVDILEVTGFDFFVIDMEHAKYDLSHVADLLQYARRSEMTGIVRIPELQYSFVAKTLDMGAEGIWVPHVDTEDEAKKIVQYARYPPEGSRGAAVPAFRTKEFNEAKSPADYFRACNEEVLLIAQIESALGLSNVDKIAATRGIDVCMMGTLDLSLDLGCPGQRDNPDVLDGVQKVVDACRKAGIVSGNHIGNIEQLRYWMQQGMRMITYSYPQSMLIAHGREALERLKEGFTEV